MYRHHAAYIMSSGTVVLGAGVSHKESVFAVISRVPIAYPSVRIGNFTHISKVALQICAGFIVMFSFIARGKFLIWNSHKDDPKSSERRARVRSHGPLLERQRVKHGFLEIVRNKYMYTYNKRHGCYNSQLRLVRTPPLDHSVKVHNL